MAGWIKIHREIIDHWLYTEKRKFSRFEAWNDILLTVNFESNKSIIKGKLIEVNRGESLLSLDSWGKRWGWNKLVVKRFLELIQKDGMIVLKNETVTTRLTVCKYDDYQSKENADETQTKRRRNADETQTKRRQYTIKEEEEVKKERSEEVKKQKENLKENFPLCENPQTSIFENSEVAEYKPPKSKINVFVVLDELNKTFGFERKAIPTSVTGKFNARSNEGYTTDQVVTAIQNVKLAKYHIENNFQYCTLEFFSRSDTIEKYAKTPTTNGSNTTTQKPGKTTFSDQYINRLRNVLQPNNGTEADGSNQDNRTID